MRLLLVFNPHAAAGRVARLLGPLCAELEAFATVEVLQTRRAGDAAERVARRDLAGFDGLLAAGGDGTLFEALNGLYAHAAEQRVPLGVIPVGTGNAFARDLSLLPHEWRKAVEIIRARQTRRIDVGRVTTPADQYFFVNIVGAGLAADAVETASKLKMHGNAAYTLATLWHTLNLKTYPLHIEIDGEIIEENSILLEISNTRYTGTSFLIAPGARFDDGLLDVTLVRSLPRLRLLRLFPTIYKGHHVKYEEVLSFRAREIRIRRPENMPLVPDGEQRGCTPATITCMPRDLEIFT